MTGKVTYAAEESAHVPKNLTPLLHLDLFRTGNLVKELDLQLGDRVDDQRLELVLARLEPLIGTVS